MMITGIKHLAIIMDGNARWAAQRNLSKSEGHKAGAHKIRELLPEFINLKIPYVTLYTFSSENWYRSKTEVSFLIKLLKIYLRQELDYLHKSGVKIVVIGRLKFLSQELQIQINDAVELTKFNNTITLCFAFSYGSRNEIIDACMQLIACGKKIITENDFKNVLYDPKMPDVDLLIRSGGVLRISNFLLWQAAYAELYFSPKYWPDFNKTDIMDALDDYSRRKRNFGKR